MSREIHVRFSPIMITIYLLDSNHLTMPLSPVIRLVINDKLIPKNIDITERIFLFIS